MFSVIFPGQGSQLVGMGKNFYDKYDWFKIYSKKLMKHLDIRYQTSFKVKRRFRFN